MKKVLVILITLVFALGSIGTAALAAEKLLTQDAYELPEPYWGLEKAYLKEFPKLQELMDVMVTTIAGQMKDPTQDILHVRVCSALVYKMAQDLKLPREECRLSLVTDLLHDISKQDKKALLTNPALLEQSAEMTSMLRKAGFLKGSDRFWTDENLLKSRAVGGNLALIHHIAGAFQAGRILKKADFPQNDILTIQSAILGHSTGYWYFRDMVDEAAGYKDAWQTIFPEPVGNIALFAHDADLISQFVPESVVPDGSKWRLIAKNRWGAKTTKDEAHVVYYVFFRLYEEARTQPGKELAREKWDIIRPQLLKLMGLNVSDDPVKTIGIPPAFQK